MSCFEVVIAIINIVVIIVSPIAAVAIGQKLQDRSQMRKDKLDVFKVLMMNRSMGWSYESTRALNIIDVVFADDEVVRTKWGEYYTLLCIQNPNEMQKKQRQTAQDKLLEAMAKSLGYKEQVTWDKIQNPYIPQGMVDAINQQSVIQAGQEKLAGMIDLFARPATQSQEQLPTPKEDKSHADA